MIATLIVALAEGDDVDDWPAVEAQLERGVKGRTSFCEDATALLPEQAGVKNPIVDIIGEVLGSLIDAAVAIYEQRADEDRQRVKTVQTQLEATRWTRFDEIAGAS